MKYLLLASLLLVIGGCAGAKTPAHRPGSTLSRSARLDDIPLRLDVAGLRRHGRTVALGLRLNNRAPRGGDAFEIDDTFSRTGTADLGGVLLLDSRTGRELTPLSDDDLDLSFTEIAPDGSQTLSVSFPDPPWKTADVLVPHFGLFRNVPVR